MMRQISRTPFFNILGEEMAPKPGFDCAGWQRTVAVAEGVVARAERCHVPHCCRILEARIELATLALTCQGFRARDVAELLAKNPSTVTRWLNAGLQLERDKGRFRCRLDSLDRAISDRLTGNASMRYVAPQT
jgi:hypothetical protein